jgi:long-chain-fatty-acid--CoA ligase ACSBG
MSGDRGILDSEGFLKITGRIKELIITAGGENIAPVPIEDRFKDECYPCSNIMVIGDMQRFMSAIITFKVEIDLTNGQPSTQLDPEAIRFFKENLGLELTKSEEACRHPAVLAFV